MKDFFPDAEELAYIQAGSPAASGVTMSILKSLVRDLIVTHASHNQSEFTINVTTLRNLLDQRMKHLGLTDLDRNVFQAALSVMVRFLSHQSACTLMLIPPEGGGNEKLHVKWVAQFAAEPVLQE